MMYKRLPNSADLAQMIAMGLTPSAPSPKRRALSNSVGYRSFKVKVTGEEIFAKRDHLFYRSLDGRLFLKSELVEGE